MAKYTEYFYIFTKTVTSIVLILIIIILGYSLYNSYTGVDKFSDNFENRYNNLSKLVINNNKKFLAIEDSIISNTSILNQIRSDLENQPKIEDKDYKVQIQNLYDLNTKLETKVSKILQNIDKNKYKNSNHEFEKSSIINLILLKFKNGENIKKELIHLEKLFEGQYNNIFEKLYMFEFNKFYGLSDFNNEFNISTKNYVNSKFLKNNKNSILNFIFQFINIRPNDLNKFENSELNTLVNAKKNIEQEDINSAVKNILIIDKEKIYFKNWLSQAKIYIEFVNNMKGIK